MAKAKLEKVNAQWGICSKKVHAHERRKRPLIAAASRLVVWIKSDTLFDPIPHQEQQHNAILPTVH